MALLFDSLITTIFHPYFLSGQCTRDVIIGCIAMEQEGRNDEVRRMETNSFAPSIDSKRINTMGILERTRSRDKQSDTQKTSAMPGSLYIAQQSIKQLNSLSPSTRIKPSNAISLAVGKTGNVDKPAMQVNPMVSTSKQTNIIGQTIYETGKVKLPTRPGNVIILASEKKPSNMGNGEDPINVTNGVKPFTHSNPNVTNGVKPFTHSNPNVTNGVKPFTDSNPNITNGVKPFTHSNPNVTNGVKPMTQINPNGVKPVTQIYPNGVKPVTQIYPHVTNGVYHMMQINPNATNSVKPITQIYPNLTNGVKPMMQINPKVTMVRDR